VKPIYWGSVLTARSDDRPLPPDLTISPKPMSKKTEKIIALVAIAVVLSSIGGYFYYVMHNTFIVTVSIASHGKIITGDGRGPYEHNVDGVYIDHEYYFIIDLYNPKVRSVHVNFADAPWKDANLSDVPPGLPSRDYGMSVMIWENNQIGDFSSGYIDPFKMDVGEKFTLPEVQIQIFFYDPDTLAVVDINTIHGKGGFLAQFQNSTWINSTTAEPPQSLRDESRIEMTRISEEVWALDVDAWLVSYYGPNLYSGNQKGYVKLSLNLTINRKRVI